MSTPPSDAPGSHFDVLILGPFGLFRDGQSIETSAWQRKVQTLFRLLVTAPDRRRSRDDIVGVLWPEACSESGFRNLRVVLHMLRRELGAGSRPPTGEQLAVGHQPTILTEPGWIALNPVHEWDLDLERFEELAAVPSNEIAVLEQAAGYYRGEPLAEDRYDDWAIGLRSRVQRTWRDVCLRLARLHSDAGSAEVAIGWLERIIESDPLDEEALRLLLSSLGALDRRTEALRRYQQFAQRLKSELDLTPGRETLAIVAELRQQSTGKESNTSPADVSLPRPIPVIPRYDLGSSGHLFGREDELGRILWTLPPMHEVAPRLVMISGDAGIGKTRLLAEVAVRARRAGLLTLAGACFEHEGGIRYGPLRDAIADYVECQPEPVVRTQLNGLLADLSRIVPEVRLRLPDIEPPGSTAGEDPRLIIFLTVTKALERIAQYTPLVVLLDDLQWADASTLQLLHFVVRHASQNRTLIVGAFRNGTSPGELAIQQLATDIEESGWATSLTLNPLSTDALMLMIAERLRGRCSDGLITTLHACSDGSPLTALRILDTWRREERLLHIEGGWRLDEETSGYAPVESETA